MTTVNSFKATIPGTPFNVIESRDFFLRDEGEDAYQTEQLPIVIEGAEGDMEVNYQHGLVNVSAMFGHEILGQMVGSPIVIGGVRYGVVLQSPSIDFSEFEMKVAPPDLSFLMFNLDERKTFMGLDRPTSVESSNPLYGEMRERFLAGFSYCLQAFSEAHPTFSSGFRQAVATLEIARLRQLQERAWNDMTKRTLAIQKLMRMVPEEARRLRIGSVFSQETDTVPVECRKSDMVAEATGVYGVNVSVGDGATYVIAQMLDGSIEDFVLVADN